MVKEHLRRLKSGKIVYVNRHNRSNKKTNLIALIKKGDSVKTKNGTGIVERIDKRTYTAPMYIIELNEGKNKGERVIKTESEITR